jgi:LacI family transcriptional regulator
MAARHFVERGFHSLGLFATHPTDQLTRLRRRGFREVCLEAGLPEPRVMCCEGRTGYWPELLDWLHALPPPIGILAESDYDAALLRQAAWEAGRHIPGEISILGVGNDDLLCDAGTPSLSSIEVPMVEIGYRAAEKLDRWLRDGTPPAVEERLPPLRVIERASTDIVRQEDPRIAKALLLIQEHACEHHTVDWYAREAGINRRSLEIKFRELIKRSPREEILAQRIRRACALLETTTLGVQEVSQRCGYEHAPNFARVFRADRGMTPGAWRKAHRFRGT